jgi:hypothetical protein
MSAASSPSVSDFLRAVLPESEGNERIEIRAIDNGGLVRQYFHRSVEEADANAHSLRDKYNIYFGVALRDGEHGDAAHVTRFQSLWTDVDGKCFREGKQEALDAIRRLPLQPSAIVDTGHGYQAYYFLKEPHGRDDIVRAQHAMRGINRCLSEFAVRRLDSVHDISRVFRLPHTFNRKQEPALPVETVDFESALCYDLIDFYEAGLWEEVPAVEEVAFESAAMPVDVEAVLQRAIRAGLRPWVIGALEVPERYERQSRSELDFSAMCELVKYVEPAEAEQVWLASELGNRSKVTKRPDYRQRTIGRALAKVQKSEGTSLSAPTSLPTLDTNVGSEVRGLIELNGATLAAAGPVERTLPSMPFLGQNGYIIRGWSHVLSGYPRAGKTELAVALVREWLDLGEEVLYITEEPLSIWQARLRSIPGDWSGLTVVFGLSEDPDTPLQRAFAKNGTIVIIDTIRSLLQIRDENDNSELARVLSPWIAAARRAGATFIALHHNRKGGGEHGEGIAGGHALLGLFDMGLELERDRGGDRRRVIRPHARLVQPLELLYEQNEAGSFRALGDPRSVTRDEVKERVRSILTEAWQTTAEVREALDEPRPSDEQLRLTLKSLATSGEVERAPSISEAAQGKTHRWRLSQPVPTPAAASPTSPPTR